MLVKASATDYDTAWGPWPSNPNLLDNWYFVDPINQKEITTITGSWDTQTIDRWEIEGSQLTVTVMDDGVLLENTHETETATLCQTFETRLTHVGGNYTISVLAEDVVGTVRFRCEDNGGSWTWYFSDVLTDGLSFKTETFGNVNPDTSLSFVINLAPGASVKLKAAKLELGSVQTLAHQDADGSWVLNDPPPNKALELAKCQRYQAVIRANLATGISNGTTFYAPCALPASLRARPTVTFQGVTLYRGIQGEHIAVTGMSVQGFSENIVYLAITAETPFPAGTVGVVEVQSDDSQIIFNANP